VVKTYHELFKDKNIKVLLKYDGEREKCLYTIAFYDIPLLTDENILRRDTDKPHDVYFEFLNRKGIHNSNCEYFDFFTRSTESLIKSLGRDTIFVMTIGEDKEIVVSVSSRNGGEIYRGSNLDNFIAFLETQQ